MADVKFLKRLWNLIDVGNAAEVEILKARYADWIGQERITNDASAKAAGAGAIAAGANVFVLWAEGGVVTYRVNGNAAATDGGWIPENSGIKVRADNMASLTVYGAVGTFARMTYYREV